MESVKIDRKIAEDLIDTKLTIIINDINEILTRWKYKSTEKFIEDARKGEIEEAEDDAITLTHLLDQREDLLRLKTSWD